VTLGGTAAASSVYSPCRLWLQTTSAAAATPGNSPATGDSMLVSSASITTAAVLARAPRREPARPGSRREHTPERRGQGDRERRAARGQLGAQCDRRPDRGHRCPRYPVPGQRPAHQRCGARSRPPSTPACRTPRAGRGPAASSRPDTGRRTRRTGTRRRDTVRPTRPGSARPTGPCPPAAARSAISGLPPVPASAARAAGRQAGGRQPGAVRPKPGSGAGGSPAVGRPASYRKDAGWRTRRQHRSWWYVQ
jgi:hypothetical protein